MKNKSREASFSKKKFWTPKKIEKLFSDHRKDPVDSRLADLKQTVVDLFLQSWHLPMLNDVNRNRFFLANIKKAVPGKLVLDVGCGTGLLSLMAARHGARHVYACESNPLLYVIAKEIVEKSSYAKKITLFHCHSDHLKLGKHLPEKMDLVVSEVFSSDIFSEELISVFTSTKLLLKKNGKFLPEKLTVHACLVDFETDPANGIKGSFLTTELNEFLGPRNLIVQLKNLSHKIISDVKTLADIDLAQAKRVKFPIHFSLNRKKDKCKNPYLCIFFKIQNEKSELSSFISEKKNEIANHWGQVIFKTDLRRQYKFELSLSKKSQMTIVQHS